MNREEYEIKEYETGRCAIVSQSLRVFFTEVKTATADNRFDFFESGDLVASLKLGNVQKESIDKLNKLQSNND